MMKKLATEFLTTFLVTILMAAGSIGFATSPKFEKSFEILFEPQGPLMREAPITISLNYKLNTGLYYLADDTGSYTVIFLNPRDYNDTLSRKTYPVRYDTTYSYSTVLQTVLPDADTSYLVIKVSCGSVVSTARGYFITTGNKVEFIRYFQMPFPMDKYPSNAITADDLIRDTLTEEQLQKEYRVWLDLRKPSDLKIAKSILGSLPDSSRCKGKDTGFYILDISMDKLLKLGKRGIELDTFRGKNPASFGDSLQDSQPATDSASTQGVLPGSLNPNAPDGISLEFVDGMTAPGILPTGVPITFYLRVNNPTGALAYTPAQ